MLLQIPAETSFLDSRELLKYILVFASAPIWVPFLKALWDEFRKTMDEEGGLSGPRPSLRKQEELLREQSAEDMPQVHEPIVNANQRGSGQRIAAQGGGAKAVRGARGGQLRSGGARQGARRGFR